LRDKFRPIWRAWLSFLTWGTALIVLAVASIIFCVPQERNPGLMLALMGIPVLLYILTTVVFFFKLRCPHCRCPLVLYYSQIYSLGFSRCPKCAALLK
jgi:hypothetical protein